MSTEEKTGMTPLLVGPMTTKAVPLETVERCKTAFPNSAESWYIQPSSP